VSNCARVFFTINTSCCSLMRFILYTLEDFPPIGIKNVHGLIPDSKPYLVVKIIDISVPTTKIRGLESHSRKVKFVNPKQREVLHSHITCPVFSFHSYRNHNFTFLSTVLVWHLKSSRLFLHILYTKAACEKLKQLETVWNSCWVCPDDIMIGQLPATS
jgi:hypothetical protein